MFTIPREQAFAISRYKLHQWACMKFMPNISHALPSGGGYPGQLSLYNNLGLPYTNSYAETCRVRTYYLNWCGLGVAISKVVEVEHDKTRRSGWYQPPSPFGYDHLIPRVANHVHNPR